LAIADNEVEKMQKENTFKEYDVVEGNTNLPFNQDNEKSTAKVVDIEDLPEVTNYLYLKFRIL